MLVRRQVADEEDVLRPGKVGRILGAADEEAPIGTPPRRLDEQRLERRLAVGRIGAEIGQVGSEIGPGRHRPVDRRVDMPVERRDAARAESGAEPVERGAAGVAQHEIEIAQAAGADIGEALAAIEARQRHRRIEIVEDPHGARRVEDQTGRVDAVGAERGDDRDIGVGDHAPGLAPDVVPVLVQHELAARHLEEVAGGGIIGHVALEERDAVATAGERPAQAAPERRVAVAPGRRNGEAEDDELHAAIASFMPRTFQPSLHMTSVVTVAGPISKRRKSSTLRQSRKAQSAARMRSQCVTATTPSSGYVAASSLRKGTMRFWAAKKSSPPGGRVEERTRFQAVQPGSAASVVEAASGPGPEIDLVQRVSHLHGQLEPSRDRLGGLDRALERAREHGGDAFCREALRDPVRLPRSIRSKRHARHAAAEGVADPVVRGVADEIKGRRHLSGPRAARPRRR